MALVSFPLRACEHTWKQSRERLVGPLAGGAPLRFAVLGPGAQLERLAGGPERLVQPSDAPVERRRGKQGRHGVVDLSLIHI